MASMVDYDYSKNLHSLSGPRAVVPVILRKYPDIRSCLDVGCGNGSWGKALIENGVMDYLGVDASDAPEAGLHIPRDRFLRHDLKRKLALERRFDMALCLEVAEHLPQKMAEMLVEALTRHSDLVLFSAAAPGQRGQHHVHCRFPAYWQGLFNGVGFECTDDLRWELWEDQRVEPWYRQNLFVARRDPESAGKESRILSVRHPDLDSFTKFPGSRFQNLPEPGHRKADPHPREIRRVIFLQNGMYDKSGHWLVETKAWRREVLSQGIEWAGFAHILFGKQDSDLGMMPVIPFLPGQSRRGFSKEARLAAFLDGAMLLPEILDQRWPGDVSSDDLLYVAYSTDVEMIGIVRWLEGIPEAKRPMVAFFFHHLAHEWSVDFRKAGVRGDFHRHRLAVSRLREMKVRFRLLASGQLLATTLTSILASPVNPQNFITDCPEKIENMDLPPMHDVGLLGGGREEQGRNIWPRILEGLKKNGPSLRAVIQIPQKNDQELPDDLKEFSDAEGITFFRGVSDHAEHLRRICSCKLLLLPYTTPVYAMRFSGVFQEACVLGVPVIVPEKTPMGRMVQEGGCAGVTFRTDDPAEIAQAVVKALACYDELKQKALDLMDSWKRETSVATVLTQLRESFRKE